MIAELESNFDKFWLSDFQNISDRIHL